VDLEIAASDPVGGEGLHGAVEQLLADRLVEAAGDDGKPPARAAAARRREEPDAGSAAGHVSPGTR
jgi:hypothetical protein